MLGKNPGKNMDLGAEQMEITAPPLLVTSLSFSFSFCKIRVTPFALLHYFLELEEMKR